MDTMPGSRPTVLIIDDEASLIEMLGLVLSKAGFEVDSATSGQEGLQKAASGRPDVIVVDVMMPEMDGYEVCNRLRSDPRTARSAIVVLTARGQPVDRGMAMRSGADLYVPKPFQGKVLGEQIEELLAIGSRRSSPLGYQIMALRMGSRVGATTLVTDLAFCLAREEGRLAAAVDMVPRGGQLADRLGLSLASTSVGLPEDDAGRLAGQMIQRDSNLFVLPAPQPGPEEGQAAPQEVEQLLQTLREWHDFVVLDTPLNLGPLAPVLLASSTLILLILTPDVANLRKAELGLSAMRKAGHESLQIWPVLNMMRAEQRSFQVQVEKTLGLPVKAVLPWAPEECAEAVSTHRPVMLGHPRSPLASAIEGLAEQVVQVAESGSGGEASP